jgi:hypothetical protein
MTCRSDCGAEKRGQARLPDPELPQLDASSDSLKGSQSESESAELDNLSGQEGGLAPAPSSHQK